MKVYGLEKHTISYIEIARDLVCNNSLASNRYRLAFQHDHYMRFGKDCFSFSGTRYIGKEKGKNCGIYAVCYNPDKIKCGNKFVVHVEFRVQDIKNIKKMLGIDPLDDLGRAEDHFTMLSNQ